jgi:hypothetical protein
MPINVSLFGVSGPDFSVTMRGTAITPNGSQIYLSASLQHVLEFDPRASKLFIIDLERRTIVDSITRILGGPQGAWGDPQITPDRACGEDFTQQTFVGKSGFTPFIFPQLQLQYVTVLSIRTQPIRGPVTLFLTNIKNGIFVGNNSRSSSCYSSAGTPFTVVSAGPDNIFSPGEVVIVPLLFFKTGAGPITYSQRVVSGSPGQ